MAPASQFSYFIISSILYRPLSHGGHFGSGDLKSFVYARLASFSKSVLHKGVWIFYPNLRLSPLPTQTTAIYLSLLAISLSLCFYWIHVGQVVSLWPKRHKIQPGCPVLFFLVGSEFSRSDDKTKCEVFNTFRRVNFSGGYFNILSLVPLPSRCRPAETYIDHFRYVSVSNRSTESHVNFRSEKWRPPTSF